jgi:prepilin-type N-terminal cleavage/methylation domain-containing protein
VELMIALVLVGIIAAFGYHDRRLAELGRDRSRRRYAHVEW